MILSSFTLAQKTGIVKNNRRIYQSETDYLVSTIENRRPMLYNPCVALDLFSNTEKGLAIMATVSGA
jgi:hypothetical protein